MEAIKLYQKLERDFVTPKMSDDWAQYMSSISDFLSDNFKKRSMGLVCDFTPEVKRVYTAVFPTKKVMQQVLREGKKDTLLFVHHPSVWDIRQNPVFQQMDRGLLEQFRKSGISIYNFHVPLDNYGKYSTSLTLTQALKIKPRKPFAPYFGALAGVFGKTDCETTQKLRKRFQNAVNHRVSLYQYGNEEINKGIVAVVAGGGNDLGILKEIAEEGVNTFVTGIAVKNEHSKKEHDYAKKHKINILGGTHYSTEMFACQAMTSYFRKLGLPTKFIEDKPVLEDM